MRRSLAPSELLSTVDLNLQERPPLPPNCRPRPAMAARGSGPAANAGGSQFAGRVQWRRRVRRGPSSCCRRAGPLALVWLRTMNEIQKCCPKIKKTFFLTFIVRYIRFNTPKRLIFVLEIVTKIVFWKKAIMNLDQILLIYKSKSGSNFWVVKLFSL